MYKIRTSRGYLTAIVTNRYSSATSSVTSSCSDAYPNFGFELGVPVTNGSTSLGKARLGLLKTPNGVVNTPNFVFCATKAAMKAITPSQLRDEGTQFILSNTYHVMLQPGADIVKNMGGLQKFTAWRGPMLTDSGMYI
jgi:queuine tRNA-ribosyltransferase